jgi:hypothetical protein
MKFISRWIILLIFTFSSWSFAHCLGDSRFCEKRYDEMTYLTTHNSFNYALRGKIKKKGPLFFLFPNQERPIENQLREGVRAFMIDLHSYRDQVVLCHGGKGCPLLGMDSAVSEFKTLKTFLDNNPHEILTLILESYVSTQKMKELIENSGLIDYVHCQSPSEPWPTIQSMLEAPVHKNKNEPNFHDKGRLVILNDHVEAGDPKWNLDLFGAFAVETKYSYKKISDLDCKLNRGSLNHSLFILNHFTTLIAGKKRDAKKINQRSFLSQRSLRCQNENNKKINFLTVDFYRTGDAKQVVQELN